MIIKDRLWRLNQDLFIFSNYLTVVVGGSFVEWQLQLINSSNYFKVVIKIVHWSNHPPYRLFGFFLRTVDITKTLMNVLNRCHVDCVGCIF